MAGNKEVILYSYWRSSCSWRVRIGLALKGVEYTYKAVHLIKNGGEQHSNEYRALNPADEVPTLVINGNVLTQSLAILEYLEEEFQETGEPLLPKGKVERAAARALANLIASDTQPIQNLRVQQKVAKDFGEEHKIPWAKHWITKGLEAFEAAVSKTAGKFCVGDQVTIADICLVPQVYNARRFGVDMSQFPTITRIEAECAALPAFQKAHPDNQPDAEKS